MGWGDAFNYPNAASIFREFAGQTGFENDGARMLDISDRAILSATAYEKMQPFQWGGNSPFAAGHYPTVSGKARLVPVKHIARDDHTRAFPLRLNTGRYRDQWHTMTRTGLSPKLSQHRREPLVEVHPDTVKRMGLSDGGLAHVQTAHGTAIFRVSSTPDQRRQELFVPIHWTDQTSSGGRTGLLPGQERDPYSGQPGFKNTPTAIVPYTPEWSGFLITRDCPSKPDCTYWTRIRTMHGWVTEVSGEGDASPLLALLGSGDRAEMIDTRRGVIRSAVIVKGLLQGVLFVSREGVLPPRGWLTAQLGGVDASTTELLAGRPSTPVPDRGAIICVCFDIGMTTIVDAIATQRLTSVEAVGKAIHAGTNCGSCRPAIAQIFKTQLEAAYV